MVISLSQWFVALDSPICPKKIKGLTETSQYFQLDYKNEDVWTAFTIN